MNIEKIINNYINKYGIIIDINKMLNELKKYYSNEQLLIIEKEILIYNNNKYNELNNYINILNTNKNNNSIFIPSIKIQDNNKSEISGINIDVTNYLDNIIKSKDDIELLSIISKINNNNILTLIKCKLLEYITMYKSELLNNSLSVDDINFLNNEIDNIMDKLNYIINYEKLINNNTPNNNNKLIFLSNNDNILFLEDLKDIDPSEYHAFYSLISSIIIGTFIGNKSVFINKSQKIPEIRRVNGQRIIYDRISNNYYIILFAFDKNNNHIYKSRLVERYNLYNNIKEEIQLNLLNNNIEYINEQLDIQEKVLNLLNSKKGNCLNG